MNRRSFFGTLLAGFGLWLGFGKKAFAGEGDLVINLDEHPELEEVGSSKTIKDVKIGGQTDNILVVHKGEKEYYVLSSICRHKKCNVKYKNDKGLIICPCHGSTYDMLGKVQKGPSTTDIEAYKAVLKGNQLIVSRNQA